MHPILDLFKAKVVVVGWTLCHPVESLHLMYPSKFCLVALMRIGCLILLGRWLTHYECGKEIDVDGYHFLSCKTVEAWSDIMIC